MENIQNKSALIPSDEIRSEELLAEQKFEAFITSLAHIIEKYGMTKQEAQALVKYNDDIKNHRWASKPQIRKYDKVYNGKLRIVFGERSYIRDNDSEKLEDSNLYIKIMADTCIRRGKHTNYSSIFY